MQARNLSRLRPVIQAMALIAIAAAVAPAANADHPADSIAPYHNKNRLVLIFAPRATDARFQRQTALLAMEAAGMRERDLVVLDAVPDDEASRGAHRHLNAAENAALRRRYHVRANEFCVLLIGKDGHTALNASRPISTKALFDLIDSMPMRREEMRRKGR